MTSDTITESSVYDEDRRSQAREYFDSNSLSMTAELKEAVFKQRVELGMNPKLARLAAGSCSFRVKADPKWPANTHPITIMDAQTLHPDASEILLTFCNRTQFPREGLKTFSVSITKGVVVDIRKSPTEVKEGPVQ